MGLAQPTPLGKFTEVSREMALAATLQGFTFDPTTGRYYVCILP
jgi:hypothetical protein